MLISILAALWILSSHKNSPTIQLKLPSSFRWILIASLGILTLTLVQTIRLPKSLLQIFSPLSYRLNFQALDELALRSHPWGYPISLDVNQTQEGISFLFVFFLLSFLAHIALKSPKDRLRFANWVIIFTAALAFFGLIHRFSGSTKMFWVLEHGWTFFGPYINKNHAGALFASVAPLSLILLTKQSSRIDRFIFTGFFALICLGVLFTGSRSAVFSLGIAFGVMVFFRIGKKEYNRLGLWAFLCVAILAISWKAPSFERLLATRTSWLTGKEVRTEFWSFAWDFWRESPLFGIGLGAFRKVSPLMVGDKFWLHPEHVENDYLELLVCMGVTGVIFVSILTFFFSRRLLYVLKSKEVSITSKAYAVALISLLANALFVFHAPLPAHQIFIAILIGGITASRRYSWNFGSKIKSLAFILVGISFLFGLSTAWPFKDTSLKEEETTIIPSLDLETSKANRNAALLLHETRADELAREVEKSPLEPESLFQLSIHSAYSNNQTRAQTASRLAKGLNPFDLYHRLDVIQAFSYLKDPGIKLLEIEELLTSPIPIRNSIRANLSLDAAFLALRMKDTAAVEKYLKQVEQSSPEDWRLLLLKAFFQENQSHFVSSWERAQKSRITSGQWDNAFVSVFQISKPKLNNFAWLVNLTTKRKDIGSLLERLSSLNAIKAIRFPIIGPEGQTLFKPNNSITEKNGKWENQTLHVKVHQAQASLDAYLLPINLQATPSGLSFRMVLTSSRNLTSQLVLKIGSRLYLSKDPSHKLDSNRWELTFRRISEQIPLKDTITGVGFTPLERNGFYSIESIELFVDSTN